MRIRHAALAVAFAASASWQGPARAAPLDRPADPAPRSVSDLDPPHRYSPVLLGVLGASAAALLVGGGILVASTEIDYRSALSGSNSASCRPCSGDALASLRAREFSGYGLIGLGGVLAVTDLVLVAIDARARARGTRSDGKAVAHRAGLVPVLRF